MLMGLELSFEVFDFFLNTVVTPASFKSEVKIEFSIQTFIFHEIKYKAIENKQYKHSFLWDTNLLTNFNLFDHPRPCAHLRLMPIK